MSTITRNPTGDSWINDAQATTNHDASGVVICGFISPKGADSIRRVWLEFDISAIPAGATITDAYLDGYVDTAGGAAYACTCHRITQTAVVEAEVTWDDYSSGNAWTAGGGDYSTPTVAFNMPTATGDQTIINGMVAFCQDALDSRSGIVRMILIKDDETATGVFIVRDSETADPPVLTVEYAVRRRSGYIA